MTTTPERAVAPPTTQNREFWVLMGSAVILRRLIGYDQKYGPIAIRFGLMSFFIAIGVVITAVGLMAQDSGLSLGAAVRKLRRAS